MSWKIITFMMAFYCENPFATLSKFIPELRLWWQLQKPHKPLQEYIAAIYCEEFIQTFFTGGIMTYNVTNFKKLSYTNNFTISHKNI